MKLINFLYSFLCLWPIYFPLCSENMQAVCAIKAMFPNIRIRKNKVSPLLFFLVLDSREDPWNVCKAEFIYVYLNPNGEMFENTLGVSERRKKCIDRIIGQHIRFSRLESHGGNV